MRELVTLLKLTKRLMNTGSFHMRSHQVCGLFHGRSPQGAKLGKWRHGWCTMIYDNEDNVMMLRMEQAAGFLSLDFEDVCACIFSVEKLRRGHEERDPEEG